MAPLREESLRNRDISCLPLNMCLAKRSEDGQSCLSVVDHLRLVGHVAERLLARMPEPVRKWIPTGAVTLAALHDVGKISPGFQQKIWGDTPVPQVGSLREWGGGFTDDHSQIGESAVRDYCKQQKLPEEWAVVVGLHHGNHSQPLSHHKECYGGSPWADLRLQVIEQIVSLFGPLPDQQPPSTYTALTGLVCVADWVASDETLFPYNRPVDQLVRVIDTVLDQLGFYWPQPKPGFRFEDLFGFAPHKIQADTHRLADRPGLLLVEGPMGCGKTEAALWAAYRLMVENHNHGLYFALPTRWASNLVHTRVQSFLERAFGAHAAARLLHGLAWLHQFFSDPQLSTMLGGGEDFRPGGSWFAPAKRGILWPFAVGTVDQALFGVLRVKHYFLRLFGLAGKVVILDEIHSYDMFTGTLIDSLVQRLVELGCTVIFLSGTLTHDRRKQLGLEVSGGAQAPYPLVVSRGGPVLAPPVPPVCCKQIQLQRKDPATPQFWEDLAHYLSQGASILWVCNTVARAQEAYRQLCSRLSFPATSLDVVHSLMLPWDRRRREERWATRLGKNPSNRGPGLLVATQVVEQSVDLDADLLITDLAPVDILLQRIGRLWRHPRANRPISQAECWLVDYECLQANSQEEFCSRLHPSTRVYAPYVLWRTARTLEGRTLLRFPAEVRALLEGTYIEPQPDDPPWVESLYKELCKRRQKLRDCAVGLQRGELPFLEDDESTTRYSELQTEPVVLVTSVEKRGNQWEIGFLCQKERFLWKPPKQNLFLTAKAVLNTIAVPSSWLKDVPRESLDPQLSRVFGNPARVLQWTESQVLNMLSGRPTPLRYSLEWGLHRLTENRSFYDEHLQPS